MRARVAFGKRSGTMDQGQGPRNTDEGLGTKDQGPRTKDMGLGTVAIARRSSKTLVVTAGDPRQRPDANGDQGPRTDDRGPSTRDLGQGTRDHALRVTGNPFNPASNHAVLSSGTTRSAAEAVAGK